MGEPPTAEAWWRGLLHRAALSLERQGQSSQQNGSGDRDKASGQDDPRQGVQMFGLSRIRFQSDSVSGFSGPPAAPQQAGYWGGIPNRPPLPQGCCVGYTR